MEKYTIAVVGNPNSGKTTLFNGLTGSNQRIGNWPGVTVEKKEGTGEYNGEKYHYVDLPGIYSLFAFSEDERIARDYIVTEHPDLVVNIVDATNIERNLYLTTQLLEMRVPMLIVLNMVDLAEKQHLKIEFEHLSRHLEVPCIGISAVRGGDIQRVKASIEQAVRKRPVSSVEVPYPNEIEEVISSWTSKLSKAAQHIGTTERWIAVKLLEEEEWTSRRVFENSSLTEEDIRAAVSGAEAILGESADAIVADYRYGFIHGLVKDVITKTAGRRSVTDNIDKVVMHRFLGIPIFFITMFLVFLVTIGLGNRLIGLFEELFGIIFINGTEKLLELFHAPGWLHAVLVGGLGTGIQTVGAFIPIIFLMFFMLALLEDSGYMARAAFVMDKFMGRLGLPGKSFVPMIVGFGCTVPAIMAARTLDNRRDRILTVFMTPFMSCGARLPVYSVIASVFFLRHQGMVVFSLYLVGVVVAVLSGLLLRKTIFLGETSHLIMELPPYHSPRAKHIMMHTWLNLKGFLFRAGKFIIIASVLLAFLNSFGTNGTFGNEGTDTSFLTKIGKTITPVFTPFGVEKDNWPASVALFTGLFAKESVIGTMNALYGQMARKQAVDVERQRKESAFAVMRGYFANSRARAYAYLLFVLLYFPCIATLGVAIKEIGKGFSILMVSYQTIVAWIIATLFFQFTVGGSPLWIGVAVGVGAACIVILAFIGKIVRRVEHRRMSG